MSNNRNRNRNRARNASRQAANRRAADPREVARPRRDPAPDYGYPEDPREPEPDYGYPEDRHSYPEPRGSRIPEHVRQPSDRQAPRRSGADQRRAQVADALAEDVEVEVDGLFLVVEAGAVDDEEFWKTLSRTSEDPYAIVGALEVLLGAEQMGLVREQCVDERTGRVSFSKIGEFFQALFEEINPNS